MITKCGVTLLLVLHSSLHPALVFAASQLAFSCVVLGGYLTYGAQLWSQVGGTSWCGLCVVVWVTCKQTAGMRSSA
jgi:hypothetical protein